jgi:phospholipase A1/A2
MLVKCKGITLIIAGFLFSFISVEALAAGTELAFSENSALEKPYPQEIRREEEAPNLDTLHALYQPYIVNLSAYEPIYLLAGTNLRKSKLQISFKYRFLNPEGPLSTRFPWTQGFHFGYTQTSFWDLKEASAPFEDNSYKPELFFVSPNIMPGIPWLDGLFIQAGIQHESNGLSGDQSRSTNFPYLRSVIIFYNPARRSGLLLGLKIWDYIYNSSKNEDLDQFRGYFEFESKFGKTDGWVAGSTLRWASQGASVNIDLTYPVHRVLRENLNLYFQVQYANVLAESLLDYRQRTEALRLGIAIVR